MITTDTLKCELEGRLKALDVGKQHVSVRCEPGPAIVRTGVMIEEYDWDNRTHILRSLLAFEADRADEFALEFDIIPLDAVIDESFAEP